MEMIQIFIYSTTDIILKQDKYSFVRYIILTLASNLMYRNYLPLVSNWFQMHTIKTEEDVFLEKNEAALMTFII